MKSIARYISGVFFRLITGFITHCIPERMKRLIFISSLATQFNHDKTLAPETISKLNTIMGLASDCKSLHLGSQLTHVIWADDQCVGLCQVAKESEIESKRIPVLVKNICESTKPWLRYRPERMEADVSQLIEARGILAH